MVGSPHLWSMLEKSSRIPAQNHIIDFDVVRTDWLGGLTHGILTFRRLRKYVEVSTFDIPSMKLGMGSSAAQTRGTPRDGW